MWVLRTLGSLTQPQKNQHKPFLFRSQHPGLLNIALPGHLPRLFQAKIDELNHEKDTLQALQSV